MLFRGSPSSSSFSSIYFPTTAALLCAFTLSPMDYEVYPIRYKQQRPPFNGQTGILLQQVTMKPKGRSIGQMLFPLRQLTTPPWAPLVLIFHDLWGENKQGNS
jgi:hypothetical protein